MSITRKLLSAGLFVIEDSQAKHKTSDVPESIRVSYHDNEDILETVATVASIYPCPIALILSNGQVVVLAKEGKGGIALQGKENELTDEQAEAFPKVCEVLCKHYGVEMQDKPKRRTRAKAVPEAPEPHLSDETHADPITTTPEPEIALESEPEA
jgi:hypothetical protein